MGPEKEKTWAYKHKKKAQDGENRGGRQRRRTRKASRQNRRNLCQSQIHAHCHCRSQSFFSLHICVFEFISLCTYPLLFVFRCLEGKTDHESQNHAHCHCGSQKVFTYLCICVFVFESLCTRALLFVRLYLYAWIVELTMSYESAPIFIVGAKNVLYIFLVHLYLILASFCLKNCGHDFLFFFSSFFHLQ